MNLNPRTETFGQEDQTWLGSAHGTSSGRPVTLDISAFTEATHYPDGYVPSGTPIAEISASGLYAPYDDTDPDPADGTGVLAGFTLTSVSVDGTDDVQAVLFEHGRVIEANLPIAIDAAAKADVAGQIIFV